MNEQHWIERFKSKLDAMQDDEPVRVAQELEALIAGESPRFRAVLINHLASTNQDAFHYFAIMCSKDPVILSR